jgi:hypothetical protein
MRYMILFSLVISDIMTPFLKENKLHWSDAQCDIRFYFFYDKRHYDADLERK